MVDKVDSLTVENIILIPVVLVLFVIWLGFFASIALMFWSSYVLLRASSICGVIGCFMAAFAVAEVIAWVIAWGY